MTNRLQAAITAVGAYVPDYILTNQELEQMVDTTDEWIRERTGIIQRHILKGERGSSFMAVKAIENMFAKYPVDPEDIDMIICCTVTPDMVFPATANIIGDQIGAKNAWGFDLSAACSGFLYGLSVGSQFIQTGRYKKIIVVGVDKMSSIIDYTDRNTCVIFGDGGGCVLLESNESGYGIVDFMLYSDGSGAKHLHMKAGGSVRPASEETVRNREHYVYQEGQPVFKRAVVEMANASVKIMKRNHLQGKDIAWLVPHQANQRIIDACADRMGLDRSKVMLNIDKYGNTTAGTLPLCLSDWESKLKLGDNIVLASFGGGFTWGAIYLRWAYDGSQYGK
jgi:3-oxoacyl-[acyl-carrier-protein] synthase-3